MRSYVLREKGTLMETLEMWENWIGNAGGRKVRD